MDDLIQIKRHYGEKMMHLCRELFPTALETPGLLYSTLLKAFHPSRFLYDDLVRCNKIDDFKTYVYSLIDLQQDKAKSNSKTPQELLDEAGYILYECKTEKDIQSFRHYYKRPNGEVLMEYEEGTEPVPWEGEELCTFNGGRLGRCYVFFAVKKNVNEIKRENYTHPERDDEYGTSVISIQFSRGSTNTLSIKNRYNHTVEFPDSTFSNNLDNIIPGLTEAFEETYGLDITGKGINLNIPGYVLANDGKYYKYNFERDNIYYCPDNIVIDNFEVIQYDKSRYIVMDGFVIDMQEKSLKAYDEYLGDVFVEAFDDIKSIRVESIKDTNEKKVIINEDIIIILTDTNEIKSYSNPHVTKINGKFLGWSKSIEVIDLPNVEEISDYFLINNKILNKINLPKVKKVGEYFLYNNEGLKELDLPECEEIGFRFMSYNKDMERINLPKCRKIGAEFLSGNSAIKEIDLPNVERIEGDFLKQDLSLRRINLPKCKYLGPSFLEYNMELEELDLPEVEEIAYSCLFYNDKLSRVHLPKVVSIWNNFLANNHQVKELDLPNVETIGNQFLSFNHSISYVNMPKLKRVGHNFLGENLDLKELSLPSLEEVDYNFLYCNSKLEKIDIRNCRKIGTHFLINNEGLDEIYLPNLEAVGGNENAKFFNTNFKKIKIVRKEKGRNR